MTVARTAFSSLLRDAHDYTCMFADRHGRELAQGTLATPGQSGAMALGIKNIVEQLSTQELEEGDVLNMYVRNHMCFTSDCNIRHSFSPVRYDGCN